MRRTVLLAPMLLLTSCGDPVADDFEERVSLPSCGQVVAQQGENLRAADPAAWDCFDQALRGTGEAELGVTYPTDEGDPIGLWLRLAGGILEIYEDSTQDEFGSGEWAYQECAAPERLPRKAHEVHCG